jgi:hypothetical protein
MRAGSVWGVSVLTGKNQNHPQASQQRRRLRRPGSSPPARRPELFSVLAYDRSRGFEADPDGAALVDKRTLGGDPPDDILGCQYRRHRDHLF